MCQNSSYNAFIYKYLDGCPPNRIRLWAVYNKIITLKHNTITNSEVIILKGYMRALDITNSEATSAYHYSFKTQAC